MMTLLLGLILITSFLFSNVQSHDYAIKYEAPEPFPYLHGHCLDCGDPQPASPDPLVQTTWSPHVDPSKLQIYRVQKPKSMAITPPHAALHLDNDNTTTRIIVYDSCSILLDWGVERAAWLEFTIGKLPPHVHIRAGLSEWNVPYPGKTRAVQKYGNHTYRLETNPELYEGIRFTWLFVDIMNNDNNHGFEQFSIDSISLVAKVKPVNYTGFYQSSDTELTRAWYTGAYAVRLNMESNGFNTVLMERGDRVAIQGDGHPTMEAAIVAFSPFDLVADVLNQTDSGNHTVVDQSIMSYPLYWCLSVLDWFMASGDHARFETLRKDVVKVLHERISDFLDPNLDMVWMGWDDRLGNGWCAHANDGDDCGREAHLTFSGLVIRVCRDLARVLSISGYSSDGQHYHQVANRLEKKLQRVPEWPRGFGVHSAGNAINARVANSSVVDLWIKTVLSDPVTICSFSPFNQYWILQALGNADQMELALASIKLCWGPQLTLGKGCFWELGDPDWETFMEDGDEAPGLMSYCHPWSSGVTAWQTSVHGGIEPLLPGYSNAILTPYVSARYPRIETAVQTPFGAIRVNATLEPIHSTSDATLHLAVHTPVPGLVGLRTSISAADDGTCQLQNLRKVLVNGIAVALRSFDTVMSSTQGSDIINSTRFSAMRFIRIMEPGAYDIRAAYRGKACVLPARVETGSSIPPFPNPSYPGTVAVDKHSRGDGLFNYGRDGYLLIGYDEGKDRITLPNYLRNVTLHQHGWATGWLNPERTFVGMSADDPTYLPTAAPGTNQTIMRALGSVGHDETLGAQVNNSILVEITTTPNNDDEFGHEGDYSFSLYCVGSATGIKQAFRAMDLTTLNPIAPTTMITDKDQSGVWWTIKYNKSVRIRVINIHGLHISAVAFSSTNRHSSFSGVAQ